MPLNSDAIKFTGNKKEKYLIEIVNFKKDTSLVLHYGKHQLSHNTSIVELSAIFGQEIINRF